MRRRGQRDREKWYAKEVAIRLKRLWIATPGMIVLSIVSLGASPDVAKTVAPAASIVTGTYAGG